MLNHFRRLLPHNTKRCGDRIFLWLTIHSTSRVDVRYAGSDLGRCISEMKATSTCLLLHRSGEADYGDMRPPDY
ncbi:hypothetical protein SXCC_04238 [Gluconacetobacter sp. SXCC-1]|nr:hypothetical protein SXCC_04238 [Gluconacetobacter sp. SXCC-1]